MTAVDTKEYFKLKEGLKIIDPKVFISIVDSYEVVNKNLTLSENHIIKQLSNFYKNNIIKRKITKESETHV